MYTVWEMIGYFASLLVLISFFMSSVVKLRVINMIGSFIFAIYALAIRSYPTAVMNFCLVCVNIYHLARIRRTGKHFFLLPAELDSAYFQHFLQFYQQDIASYFPSFRLRQDQEDTALLVYCDTVPAGVLIGRALEDGTVEVHLDYTTPAYRDCSVGGYLYGQLAEQGYQRLMFRQPEKKHAAYLRKMGFREDGGVYVKQLTKPQDARR